MWRPRGSRLILACVSLAACRPEHVGDDGSGGNRTASSAGSYAMGAGGSDATGGQGAYSSRAMGGDVFSTPTPRYHPPAGFEDCIHATVKADCSEGWCKLPPGCFVMGSPEDEWHRGRNSENRGAVSFSNWIEVQQEELSRRQWTEITGLTPRGPEKCTDPECPVAMVSWWDAVHAANLLSKHNDLEPCYEAVECTGELGWDLSCEGVADPDKSVYECEGYRLPTRAEAEYAARAGTISTFYSGDITVYQDSTSCLVDPALEKIAWYCFNSGDRPHTGGELQPNGFGLYDMIGNLLEWSNEPMLYEISPGGLDPRGSVGTFRDRAYYGGQYDGNNYLARPAGLLGGPWSARGKRTGFRLVRTLADSESSTSPSL